MPQVTAREKERASGTVVAVQPRTVTVRAVPGNRDFAVSVPGRLKKGERRVTAPVAVGDRVDLLVAGGRAKIAAVHPRRNEIARVDSLRPPRKHVLAANVDQTVCVVSVDQPPFNHRVLDRLLLLGEAGGVTTGVCINKWDLLALADEPPLDVYARIGYEVHRASALTGAGVPEMRAALQNKVSLLIGPSGVGKSTLLNRLVPGAGLRTRPVSPATGRGVHVTTRVGWIDLPEGGVVLDTPGLRHIRPWGLDPSNLADHFPELREESRRCQFRDCRHRGEPGCAVAAAVAAGGEGRRMRYDSYLRILESLEGGELW
ncbi:MAG: ribosome small subunit-dependent GTPase A [Candidatus Eisenbacteria bacterium]|nr:ribosome small subunit-dependent GTPase A [Candidatus Eisenbacteria bacterium]